MSKKIGYLGAGAWGYCLANLLAANGHAVTLWAHDPLLIETIKKLEAHPKFPGIKLERNVHLTCDLKEAILGKDFIVESVTSKGIRPILNQILEFGTFHTPFILTSKGIEQNSLLLLPEVVFDVMGESFKNLVGCLSGPSLAEEVMHKMPTSVVSSSFDTHLSNQIKDLFTNSFFRVYPNQDLYGVAFGGAMKNIIAIASGIIDGLGFGQNSKAALITRGLHEMRKLAQYKGAKAETLNGLSGLGDLCVTSLSSLSRNYKFGRLIAEGVPIAVAKQKIGMVVEGEYTCVSACQMSKKSGVPLPISEAVYLIIYEGLDPLDAVKALLKREVKDEYL
jgi:glycerol-3-phosphate dehydrogenase (NAD(P)+)